MSVYQFASLGLAMLCKSLFLRRSQQASLCSERVVWIAFSFVNLLKRLRSRNLQGCSGASRCYIKHLHRTGAISWRKRFRRSFLRCRLCNSNEKFRFRGNSFSSATQKREQFMGKSWEMSGLPVAMWKHSLQAFLGECTVHPLHTFRQGFRRTWIARATQQPLEKVI